MATKKLVKSSDRFAVPAQSEPSIFNGGFSAERTYDYSTNTPNQSVNPGLWKPSSAPYSFLTDTSNSVLGEIGNRNIDGMSAGNGAITSAFDSVPEVTSSSGFNWGELANTKGLGGMALGLLNFGNSAFSTWMGAKNQSFLQDYYGKQQRMQVADFNANATETNRKLTERNETINRNRGIDPNSAEGQKSKADYMANWGVNKFVG